MSDPEKRFKPEDELQQPTWYPLKESERNDLGYTQVGRVAWFPSEMPNGFEVQPELIEQVVQGFGWSGLLLSRKKPAAKNPDMRLSAGLRGGVATASWALSDRKERPSSHREMNDILVLELDFDQVLAEGRQRAGGKGISGSQRQLVIGQSLNKALVDEVARAAQRKIAKEFLIDGKSFLPLLASLALELFHSVAFPDRLEPSDIIELGVAYILSLFFQLYEKKVSELEQRSKLSIIEVVVEALHQVVEMLKNGLLAEELAKTRKFPGFIPIRFAIRTGLLAMDSPQFLRATPPSSSR